MAWSTEWNADGYAEAFTGLGTRRDRSTFARANSATLLQQGELLDMYLSDGFARRIVDAVPEEMTRAGFMFEEMDDALQAAVMAKFEALKINKVLNDAVRWSRLYGGSVVIIGANDGGTLEVPLNPEGVKDVEFLRVYDRWQATIQTRNNDIMSADFGKPETWLISPHLGGLPYIVHTSRLIVFDGEALPDLLRHSNLGWGASTLQQCRDQLIRVGTSHQWANMILERNQQAVHKIPNLTQLLRAPGGTAQVQNRIDVVDMVRGILNTIVIDGAEDYEIKTQTMAGVTDVLDRFSEALSAVTGIPAFVLMGRSKAGLSNTGASELETWYAKIGAMQNDILVDPIKKITSLLLVGKTVSNWRVCFCPLYVPSAKEQSEIELNEAKAGEAKADTANIYVQMGALDPSEVRIDIADEYAINPSIEINVNSTSEKDMVAP